MVSGGTVRSGTFHPFSVLVQFTGKIWTSKEYCVSLIKKITEENGTNGTSVPLKGLSHFGRTNPALKPLMV